MENAVEPKKEGLYWAKHKPNALIRVDPTPDKDFFKWWCTLLTPFVKIAGREIDVVASFLRHRYLLSKVVSDPKILDNQLMSNDVRDTIMKECNITKGHFYVIMGKLRKNKIITADGISPKLIPSIRQDDNGYFQLLILFQDPQLKSDQNEL